LNENLIDRRVKYSSDVDTIASVTLNKGEELYKRTSLDKQPNFIKVGANMKKNKHGIKAIDLLREMDNMTSAERKVLLEIKDRMEYDPYTGQINFVVKYIPETEQEKRQLQKTYPLLWRRDLVRRVKKSHYMINPNALITSYKLQIKVWENLKQYQTP